MWLPPASLALVEPFARRHVATLSVATSTGRNLILDPAGSTLDPWHDVLGCGRHQPHLERAPTPHALAPIALQDQLHPGSTISGHRNSPYVSKDLETMRR